MRCFIVLVVLAFATSCSDNRSDLAEPAAGHEDAGRLVLSSDDAGQEADVHVIDPDPPSPPPEPELTREERCAQTPIQEVLFPP